mgnify:CR=1 FL=1
MSEPNDTQGYGPDSAPSGPPERRIGRVLVRVGISVGLFALIYWKGGDKIVHDVGAGLRAAAGRPWLLVVAVVLYTGLGTVIRGLRWQALVRPLGYPITLARSSELFMVGTAVNAYVEILAKENAGKGVRILLACPPMVNTRSSLCTPPVVCSAPRSRSQ